MHRDLGLGAVLHGDLVISVCMQDSRDDLEGYRQMLAEGRLETFWSPRGNRPHGRAD